MILSDEWFVYIYLFKAKKYYILIILSKIAKLEKNINLCQML